MVDIATLLDPTQCALVTQECQVGVVGSRSVLPELAWASRQTVVPNGARLAAAARSAGVPVIHCTAGRRRDGLGSNRNARLFGALRDSPLIVGTPEVEVVPEIGAEDGDIVLCRLHGVGPMHDTGLDTVLRNLQVRTIVGVGVSVNVGMTDFVFDAVNAGYQFVLPRDAVAGVPAEYASAVVEHTLSLLATVVDTDAVIDVWARSAA